MAILLSVGLAVLAAPVSPAGADAAFDDIAGTTHEASINAVVDAEVAGGYPDGTFRPDDEVTRGQMATFVAEALGLEGPDGGDGEVTGFTDVAGTTHEAAILAVTAAGIAGGYGDDTFRPREPVSRGQMATFLATGFDVTDDDTLRFTDVAGSTHQASIAAVAGAGIAGGFGDGTFRPGAAVTRGQMTTFLGRAMGIVDRIDPPQLPEPPDDVAATAAAGWGNNFFGQLGDGTQEVITRAQPVGVTPTWPAGAVIADIAVGIDQSCAIVDGVASCWGYNQWGQLGDGTSVTRDVPVEVDRSGVLAGTTATHVAVGRSGLDHSHVCVVADGAPYCWGGNDSGRLGDGSLDDTHTPVAVDTSGALAGRTVTAISAGVQHTCVVADGEPFCWGENFDGQLGWGFRDDLVMPEDGNEFSTVPVGLDDRGELPDAPVTDIAAGDDHTCVIAGGAPYCWGHVQLSDGSTWIKPEPVAIDTSGALAGRTATQIATSMTHTCVLADGSVFCWGGNDAGQLGDGSRVDRAVPVSVDTTGALSGTTVTDLSVGARTTCVVADAAPYCWGFNGNGQLGDGTTTDRTVPVAVDRSGVLAGATASHIDVASGHAVVTFAR